MALRYWVGGAGTWDTTSTANWSASSGGASGASVPTTSDAVIIDSGSGTPGSITLTGALAASNITVGTASWSFINGSAPRMSLAGNLNLHYLTTWSTTAPIDLSGAATFVNTNGVVISGNVVIKTTGTMIFSNDFITTGNILLDGSTARTINLNNKIVNSRVLISQMTTLPKSTLAFGTGNFVVHGNNDTVVNWASWTQTTTSGPPFNPVIRAVYPGSVGTRTFNIPSTDGTTGGILSINIEGGSDTVTFTGGQECYDLCFNDFAGTVANCSITTRAYQNSPGGANLTLSPNMQWEWSNIGTTNITILTSSGTAVGLFRSNGNVIDRNMVLSAATLLDNCTISSTRTVYGRPILGTSGNGFVLTAGRYIASTTGTTSFGTIILTAASGVVYNYSFSGLNDQTFRRPMYLSNASATDRTIIASGGGPSSNTKITSQMPLLFINSGSGNVFLDAPINDLNTAGYTGNIIVTTNFRMAGNLFLDANTTLIPTANAFPLVATSGAYNVTTNGELLQVGIMHIGPQGDASTATWTLNDNLTVYSIGRTSMNAPSGTLFLNGKELSTGNLIYNNGTINYLAGSNIRLTGSNGNIFSSVSTGTTYTGSGIILVDNATATGTRVISAPSTAFTRTPHFNILSGGGTVFITGAIRDLNFTGFTGTWNHNALQVNGNLLLVPSMSISGNGNVLTFSESGQTTVINVTTSGEILDFPIIQNEAGSTRRLTDNLQLTSSRAYNHTAGILNLNNNHAIFGLYWSIGSSTRQLAFANTSSIWITGVTNTVISASGSNFSTTGPFSKMILSNSTSTGTRIINIAAGLPTFNINVASGSDNVYVTGTVGDLALYGFTGLFDQGSLTASGNLYLSSTATYKASSNVLTLSTPSVKNVQTNGATLQFPLRFNNASGTWWLAGNANIASNVSTTLSAGTLNLNNIELSTGQFVSTGTASRTIVFGTKGQINLTGNNSNILLWDASSGYTNLTNGRIFSSYTGSTGSRVFYIVASEFAAPNIQVGPITAQRIGVFNISVGTTATDNISLEGSVFDVLLGGSAANIAPTSNTLTIYGNVTLPAGRTVFPSAAAITWAGTRGLTKLFDSNSVTINRPVTVGMTIGNVRITNNVTVGSGNITTHSSSNIDLNVNTWTTGSWFTSGATARRINFGTGQIILSGSNTQVWDMTTPTSWTFSGTRKITSTYAGSTGTRYFAFGSSLTTQQFNVSANTASEFSFGTSGTDTVSITGNIANLSLTGFTGGFANNARIIHGNLTIPSGANLVAGTGLTVFNVTITTSNIDTNGVTLPFPVTFGIAAGGTYRLLNNITLGATNAVTFNSGNLNLNNNFLITNSLVSTTSIARVLQFGTSGGIRVFGANSTIINLSGADPNSIGVQGTFNMISTYLGSTGTRTVTLSTAETHARAINVDVGSGVGNTLVIAGGSDTLAISGSGIRDMLLDGFTGTLNNATRSVYGNLTIDAAATLQGGTLTTTFTGAGPRQTIISNGKRFDFPITFNSTGGQYSLGDNLTINTANTTTLTAGAFSLNTYVFSTGILSSTSGVTRSINFGNSKIILTNGGAAGGGTVLNLTSVTGWSRTGIPNIDITGSGAGNRLDFTVASVNEDQTLDFNVTSASGQVSFLATFGNVTLNTPASVNGIWGIFLGSYKVLQPFSIVPSASGALSFNGSATRTQEIDTQGINHPYNFSFGGTGKYKLASNLLIGNDKTVTFTTGNLDLNGKTLTTGLFAATGTGTRVLTFSSGNIVLSSNTTSTVWDMNGTNFSRLGIPNVEITGGGGGTTKTISWGTAATEANSIDWKILVPTGTVSYGAGSAAGNLTINTPGAVTLAGTTIYGDYSIVNTGTLTASTSNLTFGGSSARIQRINTSGALHDQPLVFTGQGTYQLISNLRTNFTRATVFTTGNLDLNDQVLTTGVFLSNAATTRNLIFDNTSRINLTAINNTTVFSTNPFTGLSISGNAAVYVSNNIPAGNIITINPGAILEANTIGYWIQGGAANSRVAFTTNSSIRDLNFSGSASTLINSNLQIYGNITLGTTGILQGGANTWVFASTSGQELIETDGELITWPWRFDGVGGNWKLADDLTISNSNVLTLNSGNLDAGIFNVNVGTFNSFVANTRTLSIGTGNWTIYNSNTSFNVQNVNSFTVVGTGNIRMAGTDPKTFAGGGANTYPTLTNIGAGNLTITGNNNITTLSNEVMGVYWLFTPNTNTTITNWNINGTALNPIRIQSTVDNFVHFIRKDTGNITGTYLVVKDSNVKSYGGGTWYALYSTDSGNNIGWTFSSNNANFLVLFF